MEALYASAIAFIEASRYILLFLSTLLGSPVVILASGYLIHIHQLDFWPTYATVVFADIFGDIAWYWVGRVGARPFFERYGRYIGVTPEILERLERLFRRYHERILIISKLTMGFGLALGVLIAAGMTRVPFGRYLVINLSGELVWALIPIAIGYYFGNVSDLVPESFRLWFVLASFAAMLVAMRFVLKKLAAKEW